MGFYLDSQRVRELTDDLSPAITAREYVSTLSRVMATLTENPERGHYMYQRGASSLRAGLPGPAVRALASYVRRHADDPVGHRVLGIAQLHAGNVRSAILHLEVARRLLMRDVAPEMSLSDVVRTRCEIALIRLVLVPVYSMLGRRETVQRLLRETLAL